MTVTSESPIVIFYGSQTGIAESLARGINTEANSRGLKSTCLVMDSHAEVNFPTDSKIVVIVCSSTGDGEVPDNGLKFLRFLRKKTNPSDLLSHVRFALLALGDSNYSTFCGGGKKIHQKFLDLGAKEFYPRALADDVIGLDQTVEPWIEGLWEPLRTLYNKEFNESVAGKTEVSEVVEKLQKLDLPAAPATTTTSQAGPSTPAKSDSTSSPRPDQLPTTILKPLVINHPETQEILKGIPKLAEPSLKVTFLEKETRAPEEVTKILFQDRPASTPEEYTGKFPFPAKLRAASCLTSPEAVKKTLCIELDISGSNISFNPGDAFGFVCPNNEKMVLELISALNLKPETMMTIAPVNQTDSLPHTFKSPCSVFECLSYFIALGPVTKKSFYRALAESAKDAKERYYLMYLCSRAGGNEFQNLRSQGPTILDLLRTFKSCQMTMDQILDHSLTLHPRYYSITNSPLKTPHPTFAFNVYRYTTAEPHNHAQEGLCTTWIERFCDPFCNDRAQGKVVFPTQPMLPVFLKPASDFALPEDPKVPIVMIGPGTGVSPFVGFLQHRKALKESQKTEFGPAWLFYGCRDRNKDFLFKEELEGYQRDGTLSRLLVAYSREESTTETTKYVQFLMRSNGLELYDLLIAQKARIFVCGDATGMVQDVNAALCDILVDHGDMTLEEAKALLISWNDEKKIVRDVWD